MSDPVLFENTVAAISTAFGKGGIAVIRISGGDAFAVASRMFAPKSGRPVSDLPPRRAVYGEILFDGAPVDDGVLVLYPAPHSFTGENCAEISCHGGVLLTARVLESALRCGAAPAGPGEFTKRAFLNGKISLSGAEAVMDLINAENKEQLRLAGANARGALSRAVGAIYDDLLSLLAQSYVLIDYPDEDLSDLSDGEFLSALQSIRRRLSDLLSTYLTGRAVMEGVPAVIVGRPNTGKSSFLNLLLGKDRAIVSPVAGTTRDTVEDSASLGKVLLRLADTAGIRRSDDLVENLGIERTFEKLADAELIFAVFDGGAPASPEDLDLIERLLPQKERVVAVLNKSDLPARFDPALVKDFFSVPLSALSGVVPDALTSHVESLYHTGALEQTDRAVLTNARQAAAARSALDSLDRAVASLEHGESRDMAAFDAEDALRLIGALDGRSVGDEIVHQIFSRFCVGK